MSFVVLENGISVKDVLVLAEKAEASIYLSHLVICRLAISNFFFTWQTLGQVRVST
jgi:hypothetical protein